MAVAVQVTFDCVDPGALADFWAAALGYELPAPPGDFATWPEFLTANGVPEEQWNRASAVEDPDGEGPRLFFQRVPEPKLAKNRVHLDLRVAPGLVDDERMDALEAEADRLTARGASRRRRVEPSGFETGWIVMVDPEGNEFCLS